MEKDVSSVEQEGLKHLREIESDLEEIKERTPTPRRAFVNGMLHGGGAVVGGILAVILLGWLLWISGLIPGLDRVAPYIEKAITKPLSS